jgi:HAD superfamily hydrolase (TIGR01490 family)
MNLALFDFDGTITTREMLPDFFRMVVPKYRLIVGQLLLAPLIIGYKVGLVSGVTVRAAIVRVGLTRVGVARYEACGVKFAEEILPNVLRPEMVERINWHKAQGDRVVVVSGAFDVYLSHWCREHNVGLVCSALEHRDGRLTGRYRGDQCVRKEKSRRVKMAYDLASYKLVYAYGDTPEDAELLELADKKFYQGKELPSG